MTKKERDKLVVDNQALVRSIASNVYRKISRPAFNFDDLFGWGMVGLIEAADNYDESRRDFQSWAFLRVRGAMIDGMRRMDMFPRQLYEVRRDMRAQSDELTAKLGRNPEHIEIAEAMDISDSDYRTWSGRIRQMEITSCDNSGMSDDFVNGIADSLDGYVRWEQSCDLRRAVRLLHKREKYVLYYTYWAGLNQSETAEIMGINSSRVNQIKTDAIRSLKTRMADYDR